MTMEMWAFVIAKVLRKRTPRSKAETINFDDEHVYERLQARHVIVIA